MENQIIKNHLKNESKIDSYSHSLEASKRKERINSLLKFTKANSKKLSSCEFSFPCISSFTDIHNKQSVDENISSELKMKLININNAFKNRVLNGSNNKNLDIFSDKENNNYFTKNYRKFHDDINMNRYFKQDVHKIMNHPYYSIKKTKIKQNTNTNCKLYSNLNTEIDMNMPSNNQKRKVFFSFQFDNNSVSTNDNNDTNDSRTFGININKTIFRNVKESENSKKSINISILDNESILKPINRETKEKNSNETNEKVVQTNFSNRSTKLDVRI